VGEVGNDSESGNRHVKNCTIQFAYDVGACIISADDNDRIIIACAHLALMRPRAG
jgi:hypothetical protein